jgi:hypothetical protein
MPNPGKRWLCLLIFASASGLAGAGDDAPLKNASVASINEISMEVAALRALRQFEMSRAQMKALRAIAVKAPAELGLRDQGRASDEYRQALLDLRTAIIRGDEDLIDKAQDRVDSLQESELPELDDGLELTAHAKSSIKDVVKILGPRQIAAHLAAYGDEVPEPVEKFLSAIDKARACKEAEWKKLREETSEEVARIAAGLDLDKAGEIADRVVQLLIQVRALDDDEFQKEKPELIKAAREIAGNLGPFDVLHRLVERALAELLSNPRLLHALDALGA